MAKSATTWGLVATVKAPDAQILGFAAWHLELGAHRLYIYLDDPKSEAVAATLRAHPKVRVTICDEGYWRRCGLARPEKHQVRQSKNATRAYRLRAEVDWLAHIDCDEFLCPDHSVDAALSALPNTTRTARMRPQEALADSPDLYKAFLPSSPERPQIVDRLYPTFSDHLRGGFVSHTAGKVFVRSGQRDLILRIHNAFLNGQQNPGEAELPSVALLHRHAESWTEWRERFEYRFAKGSYRPDLPPARAADRGGMNLHTLFQWLMDSEGPDGLRLFFDEVMSAQGGLPDRLEAEGLLRRHKLPFQQLTRKHFTN